MSIPSRWWTVPIFGGKFGAQVTQNRVRNIFGNTSKPNKRKRFNGIPWLGRRDSDLGMAEFCGNRAFPRHSDRAGSIILSQVGRRVADARIGCDVVGDADPGDHVTLATSRFPPSTYRCKRWSSILMADLRDEFNLASHDLAVVARISDRIAVMYRGVLCEIGAAAEILQRPRHPYTESLAVLFVGRGFGE
jgi:hypothetical protein